MQDPKRAKRGRWCEGGRVVSRQLRNSSRQDGKNVTQIGGYQLSAISFQDG
jgi:hypothetical protein